MARVCAAEILKRPEVLVQASLQYAQWMLAQRMPLHVD